MSKGEFYSRRVGLNGRVRKPPEQNRIIDTDRLRILDKLRKQGPQALIDLKRYIEDANGIRDHDWDFYWVIRQMEDDALLLAKVDPDKGLTVVRLTEYGQVQLEKIGKVLGEIFNGQKA